MNTWKTKTHKGELIELPINEMTNLHLKNATITSIRNYNKLILLQEKLKKDIEAAALVALDLKDELVKRNILIKYNIKTLHNDTIDLFFDHEDTTKIIKSKVITQSNFIKPITEEIKND